MAEDDQLNRDDQDTTANATWSRLLAGNRRFAEGKPEHPWQDATTRETLIDRQNPDAAVLACSDSRVPPEIVFDAGLGDLFTVRTAGQIIDDAVLASLEYAVAKLHVSLLVILGHEGCGAIDTAAAELDAMIAATTEDPAGSLEAADEMADLDERIAEADSIILRTVGLSVWQARESELEEHADFERVHVARTIEELVTRSEVIQNALAHDRLMIVGARYQLTTGKVEVLSF
ncbi:carbonic anhydrase [Bifidobacterium vespertilionis]|uniref:Carbonic anhydrase n=1 Tax=Bifidobacterium vespertilionis TaxID=2562524 RepID=A0A5J5DTQ8_9BIFI|nr:carbonic anhydrase [Bifidobacterium vespertilionis]KAA8818616.1 carbonic anhydrase [Bifidobacterium vespertilionis]KAA8823071.1 carbonic anhydrase [Bifidobacterium vespertilionis]